MKQRQQEKGIAHLGLVLLTAAVVAATAFAGYYVWQKNKDDTAKQADNINQTNNSHEANGENEPIDPSETDRYLVVKEWGIRIAVPENLGGDISYFINDRAYRDFGGPITVDLLSKRFSDGDFKCAEIEGDVPRSVVSIYKELDSESTSSPDSPNFIRRIGDTQYYLTESTNCEQAINRKGSSQDKRLVVDLRQAVKDTLEEAQ